MSIFYITLEAAANLAPESLATMFSPSRFGPLKAAATSFLYRANDMQEAGKGKAEWMIMYEIGPNDVRKQQPIVAEGCNAGVKIHRQGVYSLQGSRSSPHFPRLESGTTPNLLVAVFLRLDPAWKEEYDRYYTEEHIHAIAKVPGWRRTRRLVNSGLPEGQLELAQLHDYDLDNGLGSKEFVQATSTKWYRDMMANAVQSKDRRTYELVGVIPK